MAPIKSERAREANDTVIIEKMDGGVYIDTDAFLETGYLHLADAGWSLRPAATRKTPVYHFNVHGHPPTQAGLVYYADAEVVDPLHDPWFVNGVLPNVYVKGTQGQLRHDREDRKQKRNVNVIFGVIGGVIILSTILLNSKALGPDVHIFQERPPNQQTQVMK